MIQSTAPAHGQNGTRRVILAEPVGAVDGEQLREPRACTMDPALDRPYRAFADGSSLLVREARRADEKQGFTLAGWQLRERHTKFLEFHPAVLLGRGFQAIDVTAVGVFDFAASFAGCRAEQVAEDGDQPRGHARSRRRRSEASS